MGSYPRTNTHRALSPKPNLQVGQIGPNSDLQETELLLRLIHHRNKNQHRTQKWWRWLCTLRRSVRKLLDIEATQEATGGWLRREDEEGKQQLEKWIRDVLINRAWIAFSTVVADTQFSALGVVLIAVLARIGKICGLPKAKAATINIDTSVKAGPGSRAIQNHLGGRKAGSGEPSEDVGKAVQRSSVGEAQRGPSYEVVGRVTASLDVMPASIAPDDQGKEPELSKTTTKKREDSAPGVRPVKRRKKTNPIDDLFGGLL